MNFGDKSEAGAKTAHIAMQRHESDHHGYVCLTQSGKQLNELHGTVAELKARLDALVEEARRYKG